MAKSRNKSNGAVSPENRVTVEEQGAPQTVGDTTAATPDRDRVASRAYELYQARGGSDGQALEDWLEAEREVGNREGDRGE
jgi:hypothetical protein